MCFELDPLIQPYPQEKEEEEEEEGGGGGGGEKEEAKLASCVLK